MKDWTDYRGMHTEADLSDAESHSSQDQVWTKLLEGRCGEGWDEVWFRLRAEKLKQISVDLPLKHI